MGEKQQWSHEHLKCLLETCIEEVNKVGRKGLSMHKDSWSKLGSILKQKFGMELSQKQMKNAYDNLKAKYIGWVYLKNKTGNLYNPQTNMFNLTTEEWEEFRKGHPKAAVLKTHPLPYPDLCAALFDGNSATGNEKWSSTQTTSGVGSSSCRDQPLLITGNPFLTTDDQDDDNTSHQTADPFTEPDNPSPNVNRANKRARTSKPSTPKPSGASPDPPSGTSPKTSINADDLAFEMKNALQKLTKGATVSECVEKLALATLDPLDPLCLAAYNIFGVSSDMRDVWMSLPGNPDVLKGWIKMTASSLGLIK